IVFQPGIRRDLTQYMAEGGWYDCNLIRFRNGRPEKFAGWERAQVSQVATVGLTPSFTSGFSSGFKTHSSSLSSFSSGFNSGFQGNENPLNSFTGIPRDIISWSALDSSKYLTVAGSEKIEIMSDNNI